MRFSLASSDLASALTAVSGHSDEILDELIEEIRTGIACLYHCAEAIAMVDMLAACVQFSHSRSSRPHRSSFPQLRRRLFEDQLRFVFFPSLLWHRADVS